MGAFDAPGQSGGPELAEQLGYIIARNLLPVYDALARDGALSFVLGQVDHGAQGIAPSGCDS